MIQRNDNFKERQQEERQRAKRIVDSLEAHNHSLMGKEHAHTLAQNISFSLMDADKLERAMKLSEKFLAEFETHLS